jgi:hypothetical protein
VIIRLSAANNGADAPWDGPCGLAHRAFAAANDRLPQLLLAAIGVCPIDLAHLYYTLILSVNFINNHYTQQAYGLSQIPRKGMEEASAA